MMPRPFFLLILNALYKGFQMRYHLLQKFFGKMVKIKETSFLFTRGMTLMFGNCIYIYSLRQLLIFGHIMVFPFPQFSPFFQKNLETNDTSFESPKIEHLESGKKLGVALPWSWPCPPKQKSTSFSRICLEHFMTKFAQFQNFFQTMGNRDFF